MSDQELRIYLDGVTNTRRWDSFVHRPSDIIIATPAKCGTTWTQTIVASLIWPSGSPPEPVMILSPWVDGRIEPVEIMAERVEQQTHRRFLKTHTPADGVPWWDTASYIVVLRDGRDAFMSLVNHMARMRPEAQAMIDAQALAEGGEPLQWTSDVHKDFAYWIASQESVPSFLSSWWPRRRQKNVLFVHYNDLKTDLGGEMRRIADFLRIDVAPSLWDGAVERCTFASMQARGDEIGPFEMLFEGGAKSFLFKGTNGRWRDVLTESELASYQAHVKQSLSPAAAEWIEKGSLALEKRPNEMD